MFDPNVGNYLTPPAVQQMPTLLGLPIIESDDIAPGVVFLNQEERIIYMHHLDVLTLRYPDPIVRLEAGSEWIIEQGWRKWERVCADLHAAGADDRRIIAEAESGQAVESAVAAFAKFVEAASAAHARVADAFAGFPTFLGRGGDE